MARTCADCGEPIRNPDAAEVCTEAHPDRDDRQPVLVHDTCPCPEHGWGSKEPYGREER